MKLKVYVYEHCNKCQRAIEFLENEKIAHFTVPIRETPPTRAELKRMLRHQGNKLRRLLNTTGMDFLHMKLGDRLRFMSEQEVLGMMEKNGDLVRRPFVLTKEGGLVGFREDEWRKNFFPSKKTDTRKKRTAVNKTPRSH